MNATIVLFLFAGHKLLYHPAGPPVSQLDHIDQVSSQAASLGQSGRSACTALVLDSAAAAAAAGGEEEAALEAQGQKQQPASMGGQGCGGSTSSYASAVDAAREISCSDAKDLLPEMSPGKQPSVSRHHVCQGPLTSLDLCYA